MSRRASTSSTSSWVTVDSLPPPPPLPPAYFDAPPPPPGGDGGELVPGEPGYGPLNIPPGESAVPFYTTELSEVGEDLGARYWELSSEPRTERSARMYLMSLDRRYKALLFGFFLVGLVGIIVLVVLLARG